jgi:hypothetical protein
MLWQHFAHQEDFLAASGDRLAHEALRSAVAVHLGRIDQRHTQIETQAQSRDFLAPALRTFAEVPRALPQGRNVLTGREPGRLNSYW